MIKKVKQYYNNNILTLGLFHISGLLTLLFLDRSGTVLEKVGLEP